MTNDLEKLTSEIRQVHRESLDDRQIVVGTELLSHWLDRLQRLTQQLPPAVEGQQSETDQDVQLSTLRELMMFCEAEMQIATNQSTHCREYKNFRSAEVHNAYAKAMHKVWSRIRQLIPKEAASSTDGIGDT